MFSVRISNNISQSDAKISLILEWSTPVKYNSIVY